MERSIKELYGTIRQLPFPVLGRSTGDFVLYDGLLAGCADRALAGASVNPSEVPIPDAETVSVVEDLRRKDARTLEESEFVRYYDLLEKLRMAMASAQSSAPKF